LVSTAAVPAASELVATAALDDRCCANQLGHRASVGYTCCNLGWFHRRQWQRPDTAVVAIAQYSTLVSAGGPVTTTVMVGAARPLKEQSMPFHPNQPGPSSVLSSQIVRENFADVDQRVVTLNTTVGTLNTKIDNVGVPTGGAVGQFLRKNSATNFDTNWATPPVAQGLPTSGAAGFILQKNSASDFDAGWVDPATAAASWATTATGIGENWIDGRPILRQVILATTGPSTNAWRALRQRAPNTALDYGPIANFHEIVRFDGDIQTSDGWITPISFVASGGTFFALRISLGPPPVANPPIGTIQEMHGDAAFTNRPIALVVYYV